MVPRMTPAAVQQFNQETAAREPSWDVLWWPTRFLITKMDGQRVPRTPIEDGGLTRTRPSRGVAHASRSRGARLNSSCQPDNNQSEKVSLRVPLRELPRVLLKCC